MGLRWLLLAVYKFDDLFVVMKEVINDKNFLRMYPISDSYLWQCKSEITEALNLL